MTDKKNTLVPLSSSRKTLLSGKQDVSSDDAHALVHLAIARRSTGHAQQSKAINTVRQAIDRNPEFAATALRMLMQTDIR